MPTATHLTLVKPVQTTTRRQQPYQEESREARVVKARLKELGKNVDWLARELNVTPATIYNEISGRHAMPRGRYYKMLKKLGIDENLLYGVYQA